MRKIIIIATLIALISGCDSKFAVKAEKLCNSPFESSIELIWCDEKYTGSIVRENSSSIELSLTSEKLTSEITYSIKDEGLTVQMEGLEFSMPYQKAPSESPVMIIYESLMLMPQVDISVDKGAAVIQLPKAEITYDNKLDKPLNIKMADGELIFKNFKYT